MAEAPRSPEKRSIEVIRRLRNIHGFLSKASYREAMRLFRDPGDDKLVLQFAHHPFQFPEPIRQLLTLLETHVYEAAVNHYLIDVVKTKKVFDAEKLQEILDNVQIVQDVAFLEEVIIEREHRDRENDPEEGRHIAHQDWRKIIARIDVAYREPVEQRRLPESPNLFTLKEKRFHWKVWDELDVMEWVKQFIVNQQYLDLIEYNAFNGSKLQEFLDSGTQWKTAKFPFSLFVQLNLHLNRVINERNGHKYEIN